MPPLPRYDQRTQTPAGGVESGVRIDDSVARAISRAGTVLGEVGEDMQRRDNQAAAKRADVALGQAVNDALYGEDGLYGKSGEDALNASGPALEKIRAARRQIEGTLRNRWQQDTFGSVADQRMLDLERQVGSFQQRERKTYLNDVSVARQGSAATDWQNALLVGDVEAAARARQAIVSEVIGRGDLNGAAPEVVISERNAALSEAAVKAVQAKMAEDPLAAETLLASLEGDIDGVVAATLRGRLKDAADTRAAALAANGSAVVLGDGARPGVEAQGMSYFTGQGWSAVQAAGIMGSIAHESGGRTDARNPRDGRDGSDSIGLAQWNAGRARALQSFAADRGLNPNSAEAQLAYLQHELQTSESAAARRLRSARTVEEATAAMNDFLRPQGWRQGGRPEEVNGWSSRLANAKRIAGAVVQPLAPNASLADVEAWAVKAGGGDPERTARFRAEGEAKVRQREQLEAERERQLVDDVWRFAETATSESQIPADKWTSLKPQQRDAFRSHIRGNSTGTTAQTDPITFARLAGLYASDPRSFARLDPTTYLNSLSPGDFQQVVGWRTQAIQAGAPKPAERVTIQSAMSISSNLLKAAGVKKPEELQQFQGALLGRMMQRQAAGQPADDAAVLEEARLLLREGADRPGGRGTVRAFEVPASGFYPRIPGRAEKDIVAALRVRLGREPSRAEIADYYRRGVAQGLFQ